MKKVILFSSIILFSIAEIFTQVPTILTTSTPGGTNSTGNLPTISTTPDPNAPVITDSTTSSTESTTATTTESTTTTPEPPAGPCNGKEGEISADYSDCSRFRVCTQTVPIYFYCPKNHVFRSGQNRCVVGNSKTCEITQISELCSNTFFGAYPHPDNPDRFIACLNGAPSTLSCGTGKTFEAPLSKCVNTG